MGHPPAFIFVVRHGKRLDAADRQWHLTSPTPYDPPLTYGGWLQSRAVGARIDSILRGQSTDPITRKPRRFRIIIHSSPFLRCVQTSISIGAGLATHSEYHANKSLLRLDAFLGEWLDPSYFAHITPPPESALMLATAKAELLRHENYQEYQNHHHTHARIHSATSNQLWSAASPAASALERLSSLANNLPVNNGETRDSTATRASRSMTVQHQSRPAYISPVPSYALSSSEPIPKGYVVHARDACVKVDLHWDSSRDTMGWGDGGQLPEEWPSMHQRFRKGLKRMVDWYASTENPGELVSRHYDGPHTAQTPHDGDADVEDVVILVSHGAGCNALIGAITQEPVLSDVGMSSLTMAKRRPDFDYTKYTFTREKSFSSLDAARLKTRASLPEMYEMKLVANTEHLQSGSSTPTPGRSVSLAGTNPRSRFNALKDINFGAQYGAPSNGNRSNSADGSLGGLKRSSGLSPTSEPAQTPCPSLFTPNQASDTVGSEMTSFSTATRSSRSGSAGLWTLKAKDEAQVVAVESPMVVNPNHGRPNIQTSDITSKQHVKEVITALEQPNSETKKDVSMTEPPVRGKTHPVSNNHDDHDEEDDYFDEDSTPHLWAGTGNGGLWGAPMPPEEAERLRDHTTHKRRWTVNERG
ncbi:hypothetical protein F5Y16DRAFT_391643 [Xylariaceae sp. FL0255]|nr:hypothetical protein F5Y16DRAFT_391643 [Xylariaceae sp. FL0255]